MISIRESEIELTKHSVDLSIISPPLSPPQLRKLHKTKNGYRILGDEAAPSSRSDQHPIDLLESVTEFLQHSNRRNHRVTCLRNINAIGADEPRGQRNARSRTAAGDTLGVRVARMFKLIVEAHIVHMFKDVVVGSRSDDWLPTSLTFGRLRHATTLFPTSSNGTIRCLRGPITQRRDTASHSGLLGS